MPESKGKTKKGLGRGLGAFFDNVSAEIENTENAEKTAEEKNGVKKIKIRDIEPNPEQPRRNFDKEKLEELAMMMFPLYRRFYPAEIRSIFSYFTRYYASKHLSMFAPSARSFSAKRS